MKLAQLREHWQGAVQRAAQRRTLVDGLIRHWHLYTHALRKLTTLLTLARTLMSPASLTHCSVTQLRHSHSQLEVSDCVCVCVLVLHMYSIYNPVYYLCCSLSSQFLSTISLTSTPSFSSKGPSPPTCSYWMWVVSFSLSAMRKLRQGYRWNLLPCRRTGSTPSACWERR